MAGCIGYKESLVLSLKDTWTAADLIQLLMIKVPGDAVMYHSRECKSTVNEGQSVSYLCNLWFSNLTSKFEIETTTDQFFKQESEIQQNCRTEDTWSEGNYENKIFAEETSCNIETNNEDETEGKSCDEILLQSSKYQDARFVKDQRKHFQVR